MLFILYRSERLIDTSSDSGVSTDSNIEEGLPEPVYKLM